MQSDRPGRMSRDGGCYNGEYGLLLWDSSGVDESGSRRKRRIMWQRFVRDAARAMARGLTQDEYRPVASTLLCGRRFDWGTPRTSESRVTGTEWFTTSTRCDRCTTIKSIRVRECHKFLLWQAEPRNSASSNRFFPQQDILGKLLCLEIPPETPTTMTVDEPARLSAT